MKVFLGGNLVSTSETLKSLKSGLKLKYFDPSSLPNDFHSFKINKEEWANCDFCLYVMTPLMKGFDNIVSVVDDSNKRPNKPYIVLSLRIVGQNLLNIRLSLLKQLGKR